MVCGLGHRGAQDKKGIWAWSLGEGIEREDKEAGQGETCRGQTPPSLGT